MKILMLTPYLPYPPSSGGQIRSYNLIKQLSKKHQITLCALIKYDDERKFVDALKPFCKNVYLFKRPEKPWTLSNILRTGFSTLPFLVIRNFSQTEKKALKKIVKEGDFDIIHAETFYVYPHIPDTDIPVILVDQTIEYEVYRHYVDNYRIPFLKPLLYIDVLKMKYWEIYYWKKAARVIAVSEKDGLKMKNIEKGIRVEIVPNGVGEDLMAASPVHYSRNILFIGNYYWMQNVEAVRILAKDVFPKILNYVPDATLILAGQNTEKINDLGSSQIKIVNLEVDDIDGVKNVYQTCGVLVAPLYGPGGTRLKILGAMAAKLPVITTPVGISGIDAIDGVSVLIGKTTTELAQLTVKVLTNKKLYGRIASDARKLVEEKYSYEVIAEKLDKLYEEVRK